VKVQLVLLLPLLEQAPDQIALRPPATDSVIDVPTLNDADPLLLVPTLIPDGLDLTVWPLRPLTLTVNVADCGGGGGGGDADPGVTVSVAVLVMALRVADRVTGVDADTPVVAMSKTAVWDPTGTVTLAGTDATPPLLLDSETVVGVCADIDSTTTPCTLVPPVTLSGLIVKLDSVLLDDPAGFTVSVADRVDPL
jgi:hypothetical protein